MSTVVFEPGIAGLARVVRELAQANELADIQETVRRAARQLTGADGATFVLREGSLCHYADEDAISPLWKGKRFPLESCISGWAMLRGEAAIVPDVYQDDRIPHDAYRPTFVKSLAMVPIRTEEPVGAIGNYWANVHVPTAEEVELLQALADSTAVAIKNLQAREELERRVAERTAHLSESRAQLQAILDHTTAVIYLKDLSGRFILVNRSFMEKFGGGHQDLRGKTDHDLFPREVADAIRENDLRVFASRAPIEVEETVPRRDAPHTYVSLKVPLMSPQGEPHALCGISTDITELVQTQKEKERLELQLREAQRVESVGRLAGGVAHDFNNLLAVVFNYSEFVLKELGDGHPAHQDIAEIQRAAERGAALTRQLLAFSRREAVAQEPIDATLSLDNAAKLLRRTLGEDIELTLKLAPNIPPVMLGAGHLEQITTNLALNARDAMPTGGLLTIEATLAEFDEDYVRDHVDLEPGSYLCLAVSDTGSGMPEEVARQAFEPFYTTKAPGSGSGLGLATVEGIAKQAGGGVHLYSEEGYGTTIKVYLPVRGDAARSAAAGHALGGPSGTGASEHILLVEDDAPVRTIAERILRDFGYRVSVASSPDEAIELLDSGVEPDLLLTDVVMPGGSGWELAEAIRPRMPNVGTLFMSGYTPDVTLRHGVASGKARLIQKPFSSAVLLTAVRDALTERELA